MLLHWRGSLATARSRLLNATAIPKQKPLSVLSQSWQVGTIFCTVRKAGKRMNRKLLVRKGGLEPPRFYPPDPKSGASANSATFARLDSTSYELRLSSTASL